MKLTRVSWAIMLVTLLAGVLLVLGLCAGPASETDAEEAISAGRSPERRVTLVVRVQDGPSGRLVEAGSVTVRDNYRNSRPIPMLRAGSVFRLESMEPPGCAGERIFVSVTPPDGLVPEARATTFDAEISGEAETLVCTVVVWPEFRLRVEVRDRDGVLVPDARVRAHGLGPGRYRKDFVEATTDVGGTICVAGLPLIPDEPIMVRAARAHVKATVTVTPTRPGSEHLVRIVLPASFGGRPSEEKPEEGCTIRGSYRVAWEDLEPEEEPPEAPETRAVEIRVVDERGQSVPSARIWINPPSLEGTTQFLGRRTDASGRLVLEGVPRSGHAIGASLGTRHAQDWLEGTEDRMTLTIRRQPLVGGDTDPFPDGQPGTRLLLKEGSPTDIHGYVTTIDWGGDLLISVGRSAGAWDGLELDVFRRENGVETRIGKVRVMHLIWEDQACARPMSRSLRPRRGDRVVWHR